METLRSVASGSVRLSSPADVARTEVRTLPARVEAPEPGLGLGSWLEAERDGVEELLAEVGVVLLRGFEVGGVDGFGAAVESLFGPLMDYRDRATPRSAVTGRISTATDLPPQHDILLHNEGSFAHRMPGKLAFYCERPAESGGETPLADVRRVGRRIAEATRRRFEREGVLYVRNFGPGPFGLRWQDVFQTDDREELRRFCEASGIECEWRGEARLQTRQRRPAVARHPATGELAWVNHAVVLNVGSLPEAVRGVYERSFAPDELPNNTYYGDGGEIAPETLAELRAAYDAETALVRWVAGDVLLVDNLLVAHGRKPYRGARRLSVAMAEPVEWPAIAAALAPEESGAVGSGAHVGGSAVVESAGRQPARRELREFVESKLRALDRELAGGLREDTSLIRSGLVDSLTLLELTALVERLAGAPLDLAAIDMVEEWDTLAQLEAFLRARRPRDGRGG